MIDTAIALSGLRDVSRKMEVMQNALLRISTKGLKQEAERLKQDIMRRFKGGDHVLADYMYVEIEGDTITVGLQYYRNERWGNGKRKVTAWKGHNPFWAKNFFGYQPFQDALKEAGYEEISPAPKVAIQNSEGTAPEVHITAKITNQVIDRIMRDFV